MLIRKQMALILLISCGTFGVETNETKTISVTAGDSVVLDTGFGEIKGDMQILWMSGPEKPDILIAEINELKISISQEGLKVKVQMDQKTGSITIRNITRRHSGVYMAQIMTKVTILKTYHVIVYSPVPFPVITSSSPVSECQITVCAVLCSAENGPGVSLSWYKGRERLNRTSSSDLNISLSLFLEIKESNNDVYHCVVTNPVNNKTTQFSVQEHCPQHTGISHFCGFTEAAIRLVISVLVGVAIIIMLVYDVRSERVIAHNLQMAE